MDNEQIPSKEEIRDIRFKTPTFIDPLTGLFNQYYLYQFLPEEMKKAKLSNYPLTVFMIDLDGFKEVNDNFGHLCGDEVLKQLATILKKFLRQTDVVIRYAGDEFTVLLPAADQNRAQILAERLIEEVSKNIFKGKDNQDIRLTISVGYSTYPADADEMDKLIDLADKALYLSKQRGKNKVSQAKEVTLEAASYLIAMGSFPCPKFIDRELEIDRLRQTFDTVVLKSGLLQATFISGEAGIGKTRLLNELNNYVRERATIISCRCSSEHTQDPYYLFAKGISGYIEKVGIDNTGIQSIFYKFPFTELAELSRLIPSIASLVKRPLVSEQSDKNLRFLLFKSFLDFLIELNKTQAILISFDDIHWADKASLELLRYLCKQEKNKSIFIVCSFIEDKSKEITDANLKELWEDIRFNNNVTQIKLTDFTLENTTSMIETIFPRIEAGREFYELIDGTTKGNPSFIEEMLKSLVEDAVIFYQDNRWQIKKDFASDDIPLSIEEVIKKRLKNLDEETKEMIVQAAVIGEDFSADTLKKIGNKDEGFMLELLNRAKKMRLVDELESKGKFGFTNKNIQNLLYNELNDEQRNLLHYKIAQSIAEEHRENLDNVAGELLYHFNQVPQLDEAVRYKTVLSEKISQIFNSSEILEYLDKLTEEVIAEVPEAEAPEETKIAPAPQLSEQMLQETIRLIRSLQGAVKNFQLYPPGVMRTTVIKEIHATLNKIWQEVERLNLSEVEKSLVVNGKRISPKEAEQANIENFLTLIMEHSLKTISLTKEMTEADLDRFVQYLSQPASQIRERGGWTQVIKEETISGIKVDEVRLVRIGGPAKEFAGRKKIEDAMLMEFLLDKIGYGSVDKKAVLNTIINEPKKFAQTLTEAASEAVKQGKADDEAGAIANNIEKIATQILDKEPPEERDYIKDIAYVISELKSTLRNEVIRSQLLSKESRSKKIAEDIIKVTPDDVIIEMIIEECKENQDNLLVIEDFIDKILTDESRKKEISAKLEVELSKRNMDRQDIAFVNGQIEWEDLSVDKRIDSIIRLPNKYYKSEMGRIKALLDELSLKQDKQGVENLLQHLLSKSDQLGFQIGKDLMKIVSDFIKAPFFDDKVDVKQMEARLNGLLKRLNIEVDPKVFASILDIFREIIKEFTLKLQSAKNTVLEAEKPATKKNYLFIQQFLSLLSQRFKWEENRNPKIHRLISDFMTDISNTEFLEILVYSIVNSPYQIKPDIKGIFSLIGNKLVDTLIDLQSRKILGWGDSFREYIIRKGIIDLFQELGEPAIDRLGQKLSQAKGDASASLIELAGYLKKEEWIDLLVPFIYHRDPLMRRAAIIALGDIGSDRSIRIISQVLKREKDKNVYNLAKEQLKRLKAGG